MKKEFVQTDNKGRTMNAVSVENGDTTNIACNPTKEDSIVQAV